MLTHYRVRNFKNIVDLGEHFNPQPLNVIVGANGSGKTSLLQSLDFLRAFFMSSIEIYTQDKGLGLRDLPNIHRRNLSVARTVADDQSARVGPSTRIRWEVVCALQADTNGNGAGTYSYSIDLKAIHPERVVYERLVYNPRGGDPITLLERNPSDTRLWNREASEHSNSQVFAPLSSVMATLDPSRDRAKYPEMLRFREWVESFKSYSVLDPKILRSTDRGKHLELGSNGEHLAPFLASLKQKHPNDFIRLLARVKRIFPYISDITLTGGRGWGWREIQQHEAVNGSKKSLHSHQMSDGVLRLLTIASLLYVEKAPSVVMVEEPENGIHPQLLREVVALLRELTQQKPPRRCQVFFTTHSPYVLDEFLHHEEEVFLMDRRPEGAGASVSQLSNLDAKQLASLKENFPSLGEQWYSGFIGGTAKGSAVGN